MTDISALEAYAGQLSEAAALATASAQTQRQIVNGDDLTDVATESGPVPTFAKQARLRKEQTDAALTEVASQMAGAMTYATTALGILGTQNGGFFSVLSPSDNEYLILYENVAGSPVDTGKKYPSAQALITVVSDAEASAQAAAERATSAAAAAVTSESAKAVAVQSAGSAAASAASAAAVVTGGTATLAPSPGKLPLASGAGKIDPGWLNLSGEDIQLVCAGDSIMAGTTSPNTISIPQALRQYFRPLSLSVLTNDAVPGSKLDSTLGGGASSASDMVARYTANIYPKRPAATGATKSILMIDIGANDFAWWTEAQIETWCTVLDSYCRQARADGFVVVVFTIMRRQNANNNTVRHNQKRLRMNDFIRRNKNIDAYVDADQLITDLSDPALVIDGTHPTDAGNRLLARAGASEVSRLGVRVLSASMPSASLAPVVPQAAQSILDRAALQVLSGSTSSASSQKPIPAVGTGDFTAEWWCNIPLANIAANNNLMSDGAGPELCAFGVVGGSGNFASIYVLPGSASVWSSAAVFPDVWNHCAVVRTGTSMTFYLNGQPLNTVTFGASLTAPVRYFRGGPASKWARPRVYSRALSAAEIKASYERLSEFNAQETAYIYALDDGGNHAGAHVQDLSATKAHLNLLDLSKVAIKRPASKGTVRYTTTGSVVFTGAPVGARIRSWSLNVTVVGSGAVDLSDTNASGKFYNAIPSAGRSDLTLLSRFPAASGTVYCNATGYTIEHTIEWEVL